MRNFRLETLDQYSLWEFVLLAMLRAFLLSLGLREPHLRARVVDLRILFLTEMQGGGTVWSRRLDY